MLNNLRDKLIQYDEDHSTDLKYYKRKKLLLYVYNNYRVFELIIILCSLFFLYSYVHGLALSPMNQNTRFFVVSISILVCLFLTIRLIIRIFKSIFTQSKTGSLSKFESEKGK